MDTTPEEIFAEIGGQPNSCTLREYSAFARRVQRIESCRLLVFGVGRDSAAWRRVNHGNPTLFLDILSTSYQQRFEEWEKTGFAADKVALPALENAPFNKEWDCVFVDAPWGPTYGRHQSTYAASCALKPGGFIALHDCERERERIVCRVLLEENGFQLVEEVERLRIYQAPQASTGRA